MMLKKQKICLLVKISLVCALMVIQSCSHRVTGKWSYQKVKIQSGDTINSLSKKYNSHRLNIVKANPQIVKSGLVVGQTISIPIYKYNRESNPTGLLYSQNSKSSKGKKSVSSLFGSSGSTSVDLDLPLVGRITSKFGLRRGRPHHGIDIAARRGTEIAAAAPGEVIFSGWQRGYGRTIILSHKSGRYKTLYAHLNSIDVKKGELVAAGDSIGEVGATGRATGPHLHFELRDKRDIPVDPMDYLPFKPEPSKSFLFGSL